MELNGLKVLYTHWLGTTIYQTNRRFITGKVILQEYTISVFLLQNFTFNSMCYLPFLCNYLWNLLAISVWKLFRHYFLSGLENVPIKEKSFMAVWKVLSQMMYFIIR